MNKIRKIPCKVSPGAELYLDELDNLIKHCRPITPEARRNGWLEITSRNVAMYALPELYINYYEYGLDRGNMTTRGPYGDDNYAAEFTGMWRILSNEMKKRGWTRHRRCYRARLRFGHNKEITTETIWRAPPWLQPGAASSLPTLAPSLPKRLPAPSQPQQITDEMVEIALDAFLRPPMDQDYERRMRDALEAALRQNASP